ncbi:hypothetical protein OMP38_28650 [Cohnella ginsengisoli]|uniref:Uncharacterized protein n=1 Tax=Cohnella ginsengisoli TaxID=425004 RepID=A0A9X4KM20_9BACL|nr:hypothetical protein [Cohnella ginsengisoli]MDG0794365.1 hypothetical protein [Cohnella ginsengisoli]
MLPDQLPERLFADLEELGLGGGHGGRAARLAGQERHLAEHVSLAQHRQRPPRAFFRLYVERDLPAQHDVHAVPRVARAEQRLVRPQRAPLQAPEDLGQVHVGQPFKQRDIRYVHMHTST